MSTFGAFFVKMLATMDWEIESAFFVRLQPWLSLWDKYMQLQFCVKSSIAKYINFLNLNQLLFHNP